MSAEPQPRAEPFRLRGANFNLLVLRLLDARIDAVVPALGDQFKRAPGFLRFAPVVIGLGDLAVPPAEMDFVALVRELKALEIVAIGTTGGTPELRQAAIAAGLPPLRQSGGDEAAPSSAPAAPATAPVNPPPAPLAPSGLRPTMIVDQPVRAGQRVWAQGADMIVTSTVNAGAEVIADGNIHVYGALRGRAIAGGADNLGARIFAQNFDPELVSIAGFYAVREGLGKAPIGRATQVRLAGESLRFDPFGA
ncbi:septum site-determining protein MinC [Plastoroseomonas arctica]|uniref:Probable septum site-determining protein MinC n=1 Tax=Plastoroseomonas arctica TaxID=1509237 RepID=A0AAF1JWN3_9PROT|nr:septum site-determining protein MinC [Plastoroseomonas arctica]MBR0653559.1 septum site-determining protein MinC [Plastoroseomonas arctica]